MDGWFSGLFVLKVNCNRCRSPIWKEREADAPIEKLTMPGMVLRPAVPNVPGVTGPNAAVLKNWQVEQSPPVTGRPVALAREPVMPVPVGSPETVAVNGVPEFTL